MRLARVCRLEDKAMTKDPVCGMQVDETKTSTGWAVPAVASTVREGRTSYLCSPVCKKAFDQDPRKYVRTSQSEAGTKVS